MPKEYDKEVRAGLWAGKPIHGIDEFIYHDALQLLNPEMLEDEASESLERLFPEVHAPEPYFSNANVYEFYRKQLDLYVVDFPGMSVALVALLNAAYDLGVEVTVYHFMEEYRQFMPQEVARR